MAACDGDPAIVRDMIFKGASLEFAPVEGKVVCACVRVCVCVCVVGVLLLLLVCDIITPSTCTLIHSLAHNSS